MPLFDRHLPLHKRMSTRIALLVYAVVALALSLNAYLNIANFQKNQRELADSRVSVIGQDLQQNISYGLGLGLQLNEIQNLPALLKKSLAENGGLVGLAVIDDRNQLVFSTDPAAAENGVQRHWKASGKQGAKSTHLTARSEHYLSLGIPLKNGFGVDAGWLVIDYDRSQLEIRNRSMAREVVLNLLLILGAVAIVLLLGVYLFNRELVNSLARMESGMADIMEGKSPTPIQGAESELEATFQTFAAKAAAGIGAAQGDGAHHK